MRQIEDWRKEHRERVARILEQREEIQHRINTLARYIERHQPIPITHYTPGGILKRTIAG